MRLKKILLISLALFSMVACSNSNVDTETTPEERDALKILEERREFYEKSNLSIMYFIFCSSFCK